MSPSSAQIGRCGELLVQYQLLLRGIETAPLSTDAGIDLVAYSSKAKRAQTIQVKANLKPKPGGGAGSAMLDWWIPDINPAELVALVDLSEQARVWIFTRPEIEEFSQQHSKRGFHIYMYTDPTHKAKSSERRMYMHEFDEFLLENRVQALFGSEF